MRHRVNTRKLGRTSAHRLAMYRNLVTSLLEHEKLETTHEKAREVGRLAERMITLGKRGDLHARRQALRVVHGGEVQAKLFGELAERFASRAGGYTRVLRTRRRVGDAAEMSIVSLLEPVAAPAKAKGKGEKAEKAQKPEKGARKKAAGAKKAKAEKADKPAKPAKKKAGTKKAAAKKGSRKKKSSAKED
jgi:large subunit ribosomal protein L17